MKKCAAEIGIAADIYNKEDFKEIQVKDWAKEINNCESLEDLQMIWSAMNVKEQAKYQDLADEKQKSF